MATPAVKAAVAVGTAATVGYAAYQHWSEGKEREAAEEAEAAMKEERRQRWVEAMERAQQQQPGDGKGSSGGGPDLSLFAHHEEGFVFEKLAELQAMAEEAGKGSPSWLLSLPMLGEGESSSFLVLAALLLMGSNQHLEQLVLFPYLTGMPSPVIDMEDLMRFGFALSRVSAKGAHLLIRWLDTMANTCPALEHLGIDCESVDLHHPSLRPLWGLIFRQEDERPAMMCYELEGAYRGHNGPDAESELMTRLFDALGLHVSRSSLWSCVPNQQRSAVAIKKEPGRRSKHARLGSSRHSLLVTNFPLSGSHFYCGGLAFKETTSDFTFNPSNVIEAPPVQLPSEKTRDTRAKVYAQWRYSAHAAVAASRLKRFGIPRGWSLEHFQAASGCIDMIRWQPTPGAEPLDIVQLLRENDMDLIEHNGDDVREKLITQLIRRAPPNPNLHDEEARAALEEETEAFVDDFVELARTRLVSTAVCAEHRTPLDVAGPRPVVDEAMATALGAEGNSNSRLLKVLLRQTERERGQVSDRMARIPVMWEKAYTPLLIAAALMALTHLTAVGIYWILSFWPLSLLVIWVPWLTAAVVYAVSAVGTAKWAQGWARHALGAGSSAEAVSVLARFMYLSAAKYWGWKVPLALDSRELEQRCRKTLQVWGLRLMSMEMAKQVEDKQIVGGGDTLRLMDAIASAADQAASTSEDGIEAGKMPGGAETVEAWLALPCEPGRAASRGEGPGHGGSSMGVAVELAIEGARAKAAGIPQAAAFLEWVGRPTSEDPSPQCGCEHCQTRATQGCSTDGDTMARRSMEAGHRSEDGDGKGGRLTGRPTVQEFLRHHGWTFERQGMHVTYLRRAAGRSRATEAESPPPPLEGRGGPASVSNPEAPRGGPRLQLPNKVAGKRTSVKRRGRR